MIDHIQFFRQFRTESKTTGSILPSSRFLARAMTGPLERRQGPLRILEVGPGTGAVTRRIIRFLKPEDHFDLVEINQSFAQRLQSRFVNDPLFERVAPQSRLHICALKEFESDHSYDFILSGLPMNNFSADLVRETFECFFQLLAPDGVISYFEYMYVRPVRRMVSRGKERARIRDLNTIIRPVLSQYRVRRNWVFINFPPAWVQHLSRDTDISEPAVRQM